MAPFDHLFFWRLKTPTDNLWHPTAGSNPTKHLTNLPNWAEKIDVEAAVVDIAPVVAGVAGMVHLSQLNKFGWTASASVFRNAKTLFAMHRAVLLSAPLVLLLQAVGLEYRNFIPRWAHERERRRDEEDVRLQVDVGMAVGLLSWVGRMYVFNIGKRYWAPLDVVMGGGLADLLHREYVKAHGL